MNNIEDVVNRLELENLGDYDEVGQFVINLDNSDEFSNLYDLISANFDIEEGDLSEDVSDEQPAEITDEVTRCIFTDGEVEVTCDADYNNDKYQIVIGER